MIGPVRPTFLLFGSSIVQFSYDLEGWGATLAHLYARKADIVLRGYAGWNSRRALQVVEEVFPKNAIEKPSLIIIYYGGNDSTPPHPSGLGPHVPLDEYVENMRKIANHVTSLSEKTRVLFLSTPPCNEDQFNEQQRAQLLVEEEPRTINEIRGKYSEALLKLCREMNIKAIDLWTEIQKRDNWKEVSFTDGIHLSSEGSKVVVEEILKVLKEADWEPSLHWESMPIEFGEDSLQDPIRPDGKTTVNISSWTVLKNTPWD